MSPQTRETKTKVTKWNLIKLKGFYTMKETINKTKKQPTKWEKIFSNKMSHQGLICKIRKELIELNIKNKQTSKKQATQLKNGQRAWIGIFPNKTYWWPTGNREMQIKTTMRYHFTPVRMPVIKKKRQQVLASLWKN